MSLPVIRTDGRDRIIGIILERLKKLEDHGNVQPDLVSHHDLLDLDNNDDHPQYFHVPGREDDILTVSNQTVSTNSVTGCGVFSGGIGVYGDINSGGKISSNHGKEGIILGI